MKSSSYARGHWAESIACQYLEAHGFECLVRNYRFKNGEIDLILQQADLLIFVEVRYRSTVYFGSTAESIDRRKQQKIIQTAQHYLQQHPAMQNFVCRFDAIVITGKQISPQLEWIPDAFRVE